MSRLGVTALDGLAKTKESDKVCCYSRRKSRARHAAIALDFLIILTVPCLLLVLLVFLWLLTVPCCWWWCC